MHRSRVRTFTLDETSTRAQIEREGPLVGAKQAWYRAVEWMDGRRAAGDINAQYAITMAPLFVRTAPIPRAWLAGLSLPGDAHPARAPMNPEAAG